MARSVDNHKPDCRCPACTYRGRGPSVNFQVRIKPDMATWIRARGGVEFVRALLQAAREADLSLAGAPLPQPERWLPAEDQEV